MSPLAIPSHHRRRLTSFETWRTFPFLLGLTFACLPATAKFVGAHNPLGYAGEVDAETMMDKLYTMIVWAIVYVTAFIVWLQAPRSSSAAARRFPHVLAFLILAFCSILWSSYPFRALLLDVSLAGVLLIATVAAPTFVAFPELLIRQVALVLGPMQLGNLCFVLLFPDRAYDLEGRWIGWVGGANTLGSNAFCALWANAGWAFLSAKGKRFWPYLFIAASIVNLVGSNSITSLLGAVVSLLLLAGSLYGRMSRKTLLFSIAVFSAVFFTITQLVGADSLALVLGRHTTLTGRTDVWSLGMGMFAERPWLGYGFGDTQDYLVHAGLTAVNFHNTFLEVLVRLGVVGLVLFCWFLVPLIVNSFLAMRNYPPARWYASMFVGFVILGLAESRVITVRMDITILFWVCAMTFALGYRVERTRRRSNWRHGLARGADVPGEASLVSPC